MNFNEDWGNRGANIIPSARPSIHSHESCIFATSSGLSMGRFGIDDGVDEVDNVMSKPSQPISPSIFDRVKNSRSAHNNSRRNSLNYNKSYTDDDLNLLSKSAPATFPSQLPYSDDSDDDQTAQHRPGDDSFHTANRSPMNRNHSTSNTSLSDDNLSELNQEKSSQNTKLALPILSLAVIILGSLFVKLNTNNENTIVYDEFMFYGDVNNLGQKYKIDGNDVLKVQSGISTIFERQDAGSFMFVYNSDAEAFDKTKFNKFMNEVSFTTSKYLRNDSTPLHYTVIEKKDLNMEKHGELMCKFREDLHKSGVMLVNNIESIPSSLAMAFHYFCDEYNPLVKKSAIFFTIDLAKCSSKEQRSTKYAYIENCLADKWNGLPPDSIGPLLTRVVNIIIDVTNVF